MAAVFDSSALIACLAPDESATVKLKAILRSEPIAAPALLPFEFSNALLVMCRRGRMTEDEVHAASQEFLSLVVEIEAADRAQTINASVPLAIRHDLTVYDAAYLELALRRRLPLATLDDALIKAAKREKVRLL